MDWSLLLYLVIFLVPLGTAILLWRRFVVRLRKAYQAELPALRITNLSALNTADVVTLTPELENVGQGIAYDCVMQLGGWEGHFSVKAMYPRGPRHHTHAVPIVLGPDTAIRTKPISRCYLRLACHDCWEQRYEYWYPVTQVESVSTRLYDVQIDLSEPELAEPNPSIWKMWTFHRKRSTGE
jgi:hypothetical protein